MISRADASKEWSGGSKGSRVFIFESTAALFRVRYDATGEVAASYWCCPQLGRLLMPPLIVRACGSPAFGRRCGGGERDALLGRRRREKPSKRVSRAVRMARKRPRHLRHARPRTGNVQSRVSVRIERDGTRKKRRARNGKRGGFHVLMVMVPTLIPSSMPSSAGSLSCTKPPAMSADVLSRLTMSGAYSSNTASVSSGMP